MSQSPPLPSRTSEHTGEEVETNGIASPDRRKFFGLTAAACGAAALLIADKPVHASSGGDRSALLFLEELELLQTDFFRRVSSSTAYDGMEPRERDVFNLIAEQDREHAAWFRLARSRYGITSTPGSSPVRSIRNYSFPAAAFDSRIGLFPLAASLKDTAVAAYHGVVGSIGDADLIQAIASLAGVEGRHAATIRELYGINPLETAFQPALSRKEVARELAQYGFAEGAY